LINNKFLLVSVDDASGRFTNGFFWGNSYFTGSATECEYIEKNLSHYIYSKTVKNPKITTFKEIREFHSESRKRINTGFSGANTRSQIDFVKAPFQLGFYMLKLSINISYIPVSIINMLQIQMYIIANKIILISEYFLFYLHFIYFLFHKYEENVY